MLQYLDIWDIYKLLPKSADKLLFRQTMAPLYSYQDAKLLESNLEIFIQDEQLQLVRIMSWGDEERVQHTIDLPYKPVAVRSYGGMFLCICQDGSEWVVNTAFQGSRPPGKSIRVGCDGAKKLDLYSSLRGETEF